MASAGAPASRSIANCSSRDFFINATGALPSWPNCLVCFESARAAHRASSTELFGCSYVGLLNQMRLRTASPLHRERSLTVPEVCLASGFQDISHFHRCFRNRFDTTPLKYRRLSHT